MIYDIYHTPLLYITSNIYNVCYHHCATCGWEPTRCRISKLALLFWRRETGCSVAMLTPDSELTYKRPGKHRKNGKTMGKPWENHRKTIGKWRFTLW